MKNIYSIFALLFCLTTVYAQNGFNTKFSLSYPQTSITDMIVDNDTLIIYGVGLRYDSIVKQGVVVAKIDSAGQIGAINFILDSLSDKLALSQDWGKIIKTTDGGYLATCATINRNATLLVKLNHDLSTNFVKEYLDTINRSNFDFRPLEVKGGYFLFGSVQAQDYFLDGIVKYVDYSGNLIWQKNFTNNYGKRVLDIGKFSDSTFVVVTVEYINSIVGNIPAQSAKSAIYHMNLQGQITRSWYSEPEPAIGYLRKVIPLEDGSVITYGQAVKDYIWDTKVVQSTLTRFDTAFNIQWGHSFGPLGGLSSLLVLWDFAKTIDGNYVGVGRTKFAADGPTFGPGWLYKFSPEGDSLWQRKIITPFPPVHIRNGEFYGVGTLSSGSIVAAGIAYDTFSRYCWIVKISNDGCLDTLYCQVSAVPDEPTVAAPVHIHAYPVPADSDITVEYGAGPKSGSLRLLDMQGNLRQEITVPPHSTRTVLSTQELASGIYMIALCRGASSIEWAKIVITH